MKQTISDAALAPLLSLTLVIMLASTTVSLLGVSSNNDQQHSDGFALFSPITVSAFVASPSYRQRHVLYPSYSFTSTKPTSTLRNKPTAPHSALFQSASSSSTSETTNEIEEMKSEIKSMRVKELKTELKSLNIPTEDAFEKEELVKRLLDARVNQKASNKGSSSSSSPSVPTDGSSTSSNTDSDNNSNWITTPMEFFKMQGSQSIAASNEANLFLRPSPGQFPAIRLTLPSGGVLTLLVDTACSGVVLRPSVITKHNLPTIGNNPVSMTAAGGTAVGGTGLSQINSFMVGGSSFGPVPVAVQDIGALPSPLDGILGLSFLSQFATVEFDFVNGQLKLDKKNRDLPPPPGLAAVAQAEMQRTRLGIYTANTMLDGRGPIKFLIDTGAASTILNWNGLSQLSLTRDSPQVQPNTSNMGVMGADNVALALTHRITVQRRWNLDNSNKLMTGPGISMKNDGPLNVDIGALPVLDALAPDNVGGILGSDMIMRCDAVRLEGMNGPRPIFTLYK